jgi:endogenous inhibitor of DNA gyrase (YacG/DUF329 family)
MPPPDRPSDRANPQLRAVRTESKCPICGRPADEKYRPFCGKRCADIDLGRWLKESYRVPTDETLQDDDGTGTDRPLPRPTGQDR